MKKTFQKNEERLRDLWDNFKCSNIQIIGVPREEEQEIENLFETIMKKNFPNLAKEIDFQEVQEAQRVPKKLDPRKHTPRHIIITLAKIKEKERILEAAGEKDTVAATFSSTSKHEVNETIQKIKTCLKEEIVDKQ